MSPLWKVKSEKSSALEFAHAEEAAKFIQAKTKLRPKIALVLGSGLGGFADEFANPARIPYAKIPHFPRSTAIGHAGQLVIGKVEGVEVVAMQGRVHLYEGYSAQDVAFPMRVFARMGVKAAVLTNAAGGIKKEFTQGRLVVISDHINLQGVNPLTGPNDEQFGARFPDMSRAYEKKFRDLTLAEGRRLGINLGEGVYAALAGPSYETPAEIRYLRGIGADLVGMSTVPEVIALRHLGARVLGISLITDMAIADRDHHASGHEVLEVAAHSGGAFRRLVRGIVAAM